MKLKKSLLLIGLLGLSHQYVYAENNKSTLSKNQQDNPVISSVKPHYPKKALREAIEGWVKLKVDVNEQGTVTKVKVIDSKPVRIFDNAAKESMKKWQFKPKSVNGNLVPYQVSQTINFELVNYNMNTAQYEQ